MGVRATLATAAYLFRSNLVLALSSSRRPQALALGMISDSASHRATGIDDPSSDGHPTNLG